MGYRHITKSEFDYIKELIRKGNSLKKISYISNRSYFSVVRISQVENYKQFLLANKSRNNKTMAVIDNIVKGQPQEVKNTGPLFNDRKIESNNLDSILKELSNIRKANYILIMEIRKINLLINSRILDISKLEIKKVCPTTDKPEISDFIINLLCKLLLFVGIGYFLVLILKLFSVF